MSLDRIRASILALADELLGAVRYFGLYEYRVVTVDGGGLVSLQPTSRRAGVPDIARVESRPGIGGARTTPALGSTVLVAFVNGDPSRPVVVAWDSSTPTLVALDGAAVELGAAAFPVARFGDVVTVGSQTGPLTFAGTLPVISRVKA